MMKKYSGKAHLLSLLREKQGEAVSGNILAKQIGVSRVAVWKTVQALVEAGYAIQTGESGYSLDPKDEKDFLYPWEFGEKETMFFHYDNTSSTMDRAREMALKGTHGGTVFTAEKQSAGRGQNGRTWVSHSGGLFFSILERPHLTIADYNQPLLIAQIAVARLISKVCGKKAYLRWPNDVYIDRRKIAGLTTEVLGEGDSITWLSIGIGVNVNNPAPSTEAASCTEILGRPISRREILNSILDEIEKVKKEYGIQAIYHQGNCALAAEWNALSDRIGAKAAVIEAEHKKSSRSVDKSSRILAMGIFSGINPAGKCIIKMEDNAETSVLYFNRGASSLVFLNADSR